MPKLPITRINGAFRVQSTYAANPNNPTNINGFFLPQLTTVQAQAVAAQLSTSALNGLIYYDTTTNAVVGYINGTWATLYTDPVAGTFFLPTGARLTIEAIVANQVNGFIYYNTSENNVRSRINGAFTTVSTSTTIATGDGLAAGNSPFVLPTGVGSSVEVAGNAVNGNSYYNTTTNLPRIYLNGVWSTIPATPMGRANAGVGLAAGSSPLVIPTGTHNTVEGDVGNLINGFIYYDGTNIRIYNGAWNTLIIP